MALIRNSIASTIARDAIVLDLGDLREQGEQMLRAARAAAERIKTDALAERERILAGAAEKGRDEGFAAGQEAGKVEGRREGVAQALVEHRERLGKLEQSWAAALGEFSQQRDDLVQGALRDTVRLATLIGERIVKRTIQHDPTLVKDQLAAALAVVARPTEVVLRINPEDRSMAQEALPGLIAAMPAIRHVEIADDSTVERGGCVVRTRADLESGDAGGGEIDARIGTQLDRIVETLLPGSGSAGGAA